jgi:hypothetical protein
MIAKPDKVSLILTFFSILLVVFGIYHVAMMTEQRAETLFLIKQVSKHIFIS